MRWAFEDWYIDFYPRSPCGERHKSVETITVNFTFLSTLSLRRATGSAKRYQAYFDISIHALLAESDRLRRKELQRNHISIHALLAESDGAGLSSCFGRIIFLSTLSLRRATSSSLNTQQRHLAFLSTLSLRRATTTLNNIFELFPISIHALLAESDIPNSGTFRSTHNFYPRSPCGERL